MENFLKNKQFFNILLLICLAGFLILPQICSADEFDDITLRETAKYLELPENKVQDLIRSLINIFHSEWIDLVSSGYSSPEKMAVPSIMKKAVQVQALNHLLIEAPIEITGKIIKNTVKMVRLFLGQGFGSIFEEIEKESVKRAIGYGMSVLVENEIRMSPGAIEFEYKLREGGMAKALIQYIIIYKPITAKNGEMIVRFYSAESLKPPKNEGSPGMSLFMYTELTQDLPPFIVDIQGMVEDYKWIGKPSVKIDFPSEVPDLRIRPLSFWEKQILKPIETTIKDVEIIITKVTGKSPRLVDIWEEIKSFISKIKSLAPAGLVETQPAELNILDRETLENISNIITKQNDKLSPENLIEIEPQSIEIESEPKGGPVVTLEEIQEILDDISERIDVLNQQVNELVGMSGLAKIDLEDEEIEETEEAEEIEGDEFDELEEKQVAEKKEEDICNNVNINTASKKELQRITGVGPVIAQKIMEARPFYSLSDLIRVSGIGEKTLQEIMGQGCAYVDEFYSGYGGSGGGTPSLSPPPPSYLKVLISEIQIKSASSSDDEFIELYNPNNDEIDISQWSIQKSYSTSTTIYKKNFEGGNKIPAKGYFLIVYASSTDQNLLNLADMAHKTFNLASNNTIYLVADQEKIENASDINIVDMVGFGENVFSEGNPAPIPQAGKSIGRKWSTTTQSYIDTGDNQNDFEIQTPTSKSQNQTSSLPINQPPVAVFNFFPENPLINQEIIFNAASSSDSDGTITSYIWDFGDTNSTTTNQATTTYSYLTSGVEYIVKLWVVDDQGATSSPATITISVIPALNQPPIASFTFSPENPFVDDEIIFDATSSSDLDGTITSYIWDFGDSTVSTTTEVITTHNYSTSSDFLVNLTVVDDNNATNSATTTIAISFPETPAPGLFSDDFESYATGTSLDGQGDWTSSGNFIVSDIQANSGIKSVGFNNYSYLHFSAGKEGATSTLGGVSFNVRLESLPTSIVFMPTTITDSGATQVYFQADSFYILSYATNTAVLVKSGLTTGVWYNVTIEWNTDDWIYRAKIDTDDFSDWYQMEGSIQHRGIKYFAVEAINSEFYFDDIEGF